MSNTLRNIVELTKFKLRGVQKSILLHLADTVRDKDLCFFRSKYNTALRTGFDVKTIRRTLSDLVDAGILEYVGSKKYPTGPVDVYVLNLNAILALPGIEENDLRPELAAKLKPAGVGTGCPEVGPHSLGVVKERPPNHKERYLAKVLPRRQNFHADHSAREEPSDDRLIDNPKFVEWLEAERSGHE